VPERYVVFKSEDKPDEIDEDVGPFIVVHSDEPQNYDERGWMSRTQAKQLGCGTRVCPRNRRAVR
jgi:hypothetical protein